VQLQAPTVLGDGVLGFRDARRHVTAVLALIGRSCGFAAIIA